MQIAHSPSPKAIANAGQPSFLLLRTKITDAANLLIARANLFEISKVINYDLIAGFAHARSAKIIIMWLLLVSNHTCIIM